MLKSALTIFTIILAHTSFAATDITPEIRAVESDDLYKPHIGASIGVSNPNNNYDSGAQYAVQFGLQPVIPFSYNAELSYANYDRGVNELSRTSLLIKGQYNFGGNIPVIRHSYVSVGLGPVWEDETTDDGIALGIQPNAGFDIPLNNLIRDPISLGMNVSYLSTTRATPDVFNVNGVVKYWY